MWLAYPIKLGDQPKLDYLAPLFVSLISWLASVGQEYAIFFF